MNAIGFRGMNAIGFRGMNAVSFRGMNAMGFRGMNAMGFRGMNAMGFRGMNAVGFRGMNLLTGYFSCKMLCSSSGSLVVMKSTPWPIRRCMSSSLFTVHAFTFMPKR